MIHIFYQNYKTFIVVTLCNFAVYFFTNIVYNIKKRISFFSNSQRSKTSFRLSDICIRSVQRCTGIVINYRAISNGRNYCRGMHNYLEMPYKWEAYKICRSSDINTSFEKSANALFFFFVYNAKVSLYNISRFRWILWKRSFKRRM